MENRHKEEMAGTCGCGLGKNFDGMLNQVLTASAGKHRRRFHDTQRHNIGRQ